MDVFYDPVLGALRQRDLDDSGRALVGSAIQPAGVMPGADLSRSGKVILYTGSTNELHKHGHFYSCVEDTPGYYAWRDCQVGSLQVGNVSNIRCVAQGASVRLKWHDPDDYSFDGVVVAKWAGTKVVRKQGGYPNNPEDGTTIVNSTTRNQYDGNSYVDTVTDGVTYYYQFFPYTDDGVITNEAVNRVETSEITWATVSDLVLCGDAIESFSAGDVLTMAHATYGEVEFEITGFDSNVPVALAYANGNSIIWADSSNSVTVGTTVYQQKSLSSAKGTISAATGTVIVGTSHFSVTVPEKITVGGVIYSCLSHSMSLLSRKVITYLQWDAPEKAYALTEDDTFKTGKTYYTKSGDTYTEASVTVGDSVSANTYYEANPNANRVSYGYNNWEESAIRQWLNSSNAIIQWWSAQNIWDNAPGYATTLPGFLVGITESGFADAVGAVRLVTAKNTVTDGGGYRTTTDRFFLPSNSEIFGSSNNSIYEGDQYEFYIGSEQSGKIKYNSAGQTSYWWLRSPNTGNAGGVYNVNPSGALNISSAHNAPGVAPACVIC